MKAWTIGVPIAIVIFITLLIVAFMGLRTSTPTKAALDTESAAIIAALREQVDFIPPDNTDKSFITIYAESDIVATTIKVHAVPHRPQQDKIIEALRGIRAALNARPIVIRFYRAEIVVPDPNAPNSQTKSFTDDPAPLREERV